MKWACSFFSDFPCSYLMFQYCCALHKDPVRGSYLFLIMLSPFLIFPATFLVYLDAGFLQNALTIWNLLFCLSCPYTNFCCLNISYKQQHDFLCSFGGHAVHILMQNVHALSLDKPCYRMLIYYCCLHYFTMLIFNYILVNVFIIYRPFFWL